MGWASGSGIAESLWEQLKNYVKSEDYKEVTKIIVEKFEEYDADDWDLSSEDCLYYTYLELNNPKELKEYLEEYD